MYVISRNARLILAGEHVGSSGAAAASVEVSQSVSRVREVVETNRALKRSPLRRRNGEAERGSQVCFAEAVGAHELAAPLDIAQRDMLVVPAHAL